MTPDDGAQIPKDWATLISALERAHVVDEDLILQLTADAVIARKLISELGAQSVASRDRIVNLEAALANARRIGAAMGIVMTTYKITEPAAFEVLRAESQRSHRKVSHVADQIVLTGSLPTAARPPGP